MATSTHFPDRPYNSASIYLPRTRSRPGRYSYKPEMKLTDLVVRMRTFFPPPFVTPNHSAACTRLPSGVETFDLAASLEHPEKAPKLETLDTVRIFGKFDLSRIPRCCYREVRAPGALSHIGPAALRDRYFRLGRYAGMHGTTRHSYSAGARWHHTSL